MAAASVIDPRQLARVALDQAVAILGAERAFLFLVDEVDAGLEFYAGRDSEAADLAEAVGYSSTALEHARAERQALAVTGTETGGMISSDSAVVHGLRSILVAPLLLEGRLIGVVYLDSRLAKGMFTDADAEILVAIATQAAICFATARSAQLEMLVHAEREQRSLVETLRDVMAAMTATLDPAEVLDRLLAGLRRAVPYDAAYIVVPTADGIAQVVAGHGDIAGGPNACSAELDAATLAALMGLQPVIDSHAACVPPVGALAFEARSWLSAPLPMGDNIAALVVVSAIDAAYGTTQLEIARTVAAHGVVAHQNALLYTKNRRLALTDELSGLDNRRSFFDQATAKLLHARQNDHPLSAIMADIDHFKAVNDTYGHAAGDDVIRAVAIRLRAVARAGDITGRYGGEEFAIVIEGSNAIAAPIADRLRAAIAHEPIPTVAGPIAVTISIGLANLDPTDKTIEHLLARADTALYAAKHAGRNQVAHR